MDIALVIVSAATCGSFCRAATGFGSSILFEQIYTLCGQFQVAKGCESVLRMVELGMVLELSLSPVMFLMVASEAMKLWRSLLMLSLPCLPGTVLGALGLIWAQEQPETLRALKAGLNLLFLAVSIFKLSGELPSKASDERQLPLLETTRSLEPENRSDRAFCPGLLILGFVSGFLNGLIGLPGPVCMVYVASVLKSGRMTPDTCFVLSQSFFLLTTLMRGVFFSSPVMRAEWHQSVNLALLIPVPSLMALKAGWKVRKIMNPAWLLRSILILLLLSSLTGLNMSGSWLGLFSLACTGLWLITVLILLLTRH
ncbi:unnamed protein product [Effrenium voratum]|uniref:Membrane transporter protein n=1 Tax=Effrenium voratum TaxID=2562239 RepID=A0AA36JF59_9DINO|nr:unnamed protein product [Effrenium voratum]